MPMRLLDRVAIVTGGARGIGRAIVKCFAQEGARVVIADLESEAAETTCREVAAAGGDAFFVHTDVGDRGQVDALIAQTVQRYARIDILVNNAALLGENGHFLDVPVETWERVIRVNQSGVFHCAQAAARVMARARRGNIINISSVNGLTPQPRAVAYAAAKAAVESLTKSMAIDLAPYGIRVNAIAPGPIQSHQPDDAPPRPTDLTLLGRTGLPGEIAAVALFLASDESSYITGERIGVDGGKLLNAYRIYGIARPEIK
ncbi:MAG TPA: glucose 1-dehydrogenase [Caldilineaceae bacterium]|nr:glucose 1-dehydrogenase [Caldilineaceae bacterium]